MNIKGILLLVLVIILIWFIISYVMADRSLLQYYMKSGQSMTTIEPNVLASNPNGAPSNNFAYSIWFYVNDWNYRYGEAKVIYGRMGSTTSTNGGSLQDLNISGSDPCPAVVLSPIQNDVTVFLSCFPGSDRVTQTSDNSKSVIHKCTVSNIPIQKWVNLVISVYGRTLDVYVDGKLVKTCLLPGIANINNNSSVYITPSGGFNGWTSKFQYWSNALNPQDVWNIYTKGYGDSYLFYKNFNVKLSLIKNGTEQASYQI